MSNSTIYPFGQNGQAQVSAYANPLVTITTSGDVSQTIEPNTFYNFTGELTSLSLSLGNSQNLSIYYGKFSTSSSWSSGGFSVPATVVETPTSNTIDAGHTYEFSIVDNIIKVEEVII